MKNNKYQFYNFYFYKYEYYKKIIILFIKKNYNKINNIFYLKIFFNIITS